jgi:hypothetical protein
MALIFIQKPLWGSSSRMTAEVEVRAPVIAFLERGEVHSAASVLLTKIGGFVDLH